MSEIKPLAENIKPDGKRPAKARKPPKKITEDYLHNAGLYYLQRFAASSAHFRRVMMRKVDRSCAHHHDQDRAACSEAVDRLIEKFQRAGLLNDDAYLRGSVTSLRRRGLSARAITAKMAARGIGEDKVRPVMRDHDEETGSDDLRAALRLARKKRIGPFSRNGGEPDDKAMAAMARAGFGYETARQALRMPMEEAEKAIAACL